MRRTLTFPLRGVLLLGVCWSALVTAYAGTAKTYTDELDCTELGGCSMGLDFSPPQEPVTTYGVGGAPFTGNGFGMALRVVPGPGTRHAATKRGLKQHVSESRSAKARQRTHSARVPNLLRRRGAFMT